MHIETFSYTRKTVIINGTHYPRITGRSGGFRMIADLGDDKIFKIDFSDEYPEERTCGRQTATEIKGYKKIAKKDLKYFPKILESGEFEGRAWLIEEKIPLLDKPWELPKPEIIDLLTKKYKTYDIDGNWSYDLRTNEPVIYDFGFIFQAA